MTVVHSLEPTLPPTTATSREPSSFPMTSPSPAANHLNQENRQRILSKFHLLGPLQSPPVFRLKPHQNLHRQSLLPAPLRPHRRPQLLRPRSGPHKRSIQRHIDRYIVIASSYYKPSRHRWSGDHIMLARCLHPT